jgi:hypothetical protein
MRSSVARPSLRFNTEFPSKPVAIMPHALPRRNGQSFLPTATRAPWRGRATKKPAAVRLPTGTRAWLRVWARTRGVTLQIFAYGPATSSRNYHGLAVTSPRTLPWTLSGVRRTIWIRVGSWRSGLHQHLAGVQPPRYGGNGVGDTWYADRSIHVVNRARPYLKPGMPGASEGRTSRSSRSRGRPASSSAEPARRSQGRAVDLQVELAPLAHARRRGRSFRSPRKDHPAPRDDQDKEHRSRQHETE